jgi:hypothetical protein
LLARKGFYYNLYMSQFRKMESIEQAGSDGRLGGEMATA